MAEENEVPRKKARDPILMFGTIVLAVAFVVVISGYAYGQLFPDDKTPIKYGDVINVNYVGSYYGWQDGYDDGIHVYDADDTAVFDTSLWSIANDDDITKSWEFTKRDEKNYTPFKVTIGSGGALAMFENSLIGAKTGDVIHVAIPDAYGVLKDENKKVWNNLADVKIACTQKMTYDEFKSTFGLTSVTAGSYSGLKHPYGWNCNAIADSDGYVFVNHAVHDGDDFTADKGMKITIDLPAGSSEFIVKINLTDLKNDFTADNGEIKLVQFKYDGKTYYIFDIDAGLNEFTTKDTDEKTGITLYFTITVVGFQ